MGHLITMQEVADKLKIRRETVSKMLKAGRIPFINLGTDERPQYRFDYDKVLKALEN